jgi:predicted nucleic acid-binding protein
VDGEGLLPDTCAWIDFFHPRPGGLGKIIEKALNSVPVYTCGPVLAELVQGVRSPRERATLLRALGALDHLEMTEALWIRAGDLAASMRIGGVTIPFSDVLIAAIALEHGLTLLSVDRHFTMIPDLRLRGVAA